MTPAIAPLEPVQAVSAPRPPRFARRITVAGLALGGAAEWAFDGHAMGISVFLFALASLAALRLAGGREAWQTGKSSRWLIGCGLFFAAFIGLRDSSSMAALNLLGVGWCALTTIATWRGDGSVESWSVLGLFGRPLAAGASAIPAGARVFRSQVDLTRAKSFAEQWWGPTLRSVLLATPVLLVFLALLTSADSAFATHLVKLVHAASEWSLVSRCGSALWVAFVALVSTGGLSLALARRKRVTETVETPGRFTLGATEAFTVVTSLAVLLAAFDLVSIPCALSPYACALPSEVTYAEYVHQGFAQLLVASGLVLLLLLVLTPRVNLKTPLAQRAMQVQSSVLVLTTVPLVLSGVARLQLYEAAYGFTVTRVFAQATMVLVGLLLSWRGISLWVAQNRFVFGSVLIGLAMLSGLNLLDVEGFVTRENLEGAQKTGRLDVLYLGELSADSALIAKTEFPQAVLLEDSGLRCTDHTWQAWSLACARFRQ